MGSLYAELRGFFGQGRVWPLSKLKEVGVREQKFPFCEIADEIA